MARSGGNAKNMPRAGAKHKNILPNTYVPVHTSKVLAAVLERLSKTSLVALISLWPTLKNTQPVRPKNVVSNQADFARQVREAAKAMKARKCTKAKVVHAILHDYWPHGLNLLQLAQVDCQLIVDNPNANVWVSSTVKDAWGHEVPMALDPAHFLDRLAAQLSRLFMSYIYVCTHPEFPLVLVRIQVFDLSPRSARSSNSALSAQPHISSHKPYFLAVPMNSPHLIHTPGDDLVSQTVLQVVESSLARGPSQVLQLETSPHQKPVRSLHSMHVLKGSSRFAHSLGAWAPYADGAADISPLARHENHAAVVGTTSPVISSKTEEQRVQKLANLRFKGTVSGNLTSERLFDHPKPAKRRKVDSEHENAEPQRVNNPYASLAPISVAEFELQEPLDGADSTVSHVKIKFIGTDVFAGMHELAVNHESATDSFIDLETLPGWLTGEEGQSCGVVKNGAFSVRDR